MDLSQSVGPCQFCRSTTYQRTETGFLVCEHGHQSQKFWEEEQDDFDANVGVGRRIKKSRTASSQVLSTPEEQGEDRNIIRLGDIDRFNLFLGLQAVLKGQTAVMRAFFQLDTSFDVHVRRLWLAFVKATRLDYDEEVLAVREANEDTAQMLLEIASRPTPVGAEDIDDILNSDTLLEDVDIDNDGDGGSDSDSDVGGNDNSIVKVSLLPAPNWTPKHDNLGGRLKYSSPRTLIAIIYFALLEVRVPVLLADLCRLIADGILPYQDTKYLLPERVKKFLEHKRWDGVFKGKRHGVPNTRELSLLVRRVGYQMVMRGGASIRPLNLWDTLSRFFTELSLPDCFQPMIYALIEKYQITTMICDSKGNGTHDAELQILAGVVFFLKLHYPLCNLSDHDTSDSNLKKIGLPTLAELEGEWKDKVDSYFQYKDMPLRSTFPWSELDSYLKYCDSAGLRQPSQQLKLEAGSSDRLLLYPTNDPPPWRAVVLSVEQMDQLAAMRKFWTDTAIGNLEELPESYLRILQISCTIVDWAPEYLLKRINKRFEGRLQL